MAENNDDIREPQVVEEEEPTAIAKKIPGPVTVTDLAQREDGIVVVERAVQILTSLRRASIAQTHPHDWTLYKADDRITAYLESLACWNLRPLWGVDTDNVSDPYKVEHEDGTYAWCVEGDGFCRHTNTEISTVTGVCYSNEDFLVKRKLAPIRIEIEMKKTARQRMEGMLVREAAGLKRVPIEELDDVWKGTWKRSALCPRGRGFGTSAERQGAQVQQADDLQAGEEPFCEACERAGKMAKMKFVAGGVSSRTNKPYSAFWSCAVVKDHPTVQHADYMKVVHQRREASAKAAQAREPGDE